MISTAFFAMSRCRTTVTVN